MTPTAALEVPAGLRLSIIVARARNDVIGRNNQLVWSIPEELGHFKRATMGHALIIGRKTWESIGRPLPGRRMIVVSGNTDWQAEGIETVPGLQQAFELALTATDDHPSPPAEVFIAGGARLYEQTTALVSRMLITQVDLEPEGDVFFGWRPSEHWDCIARNPYCSKNGIAYEIQDWRRQS